MKYVLPIIGMVCTAFVTLLMLVFLMAGAANSTAQELRSIELWAVGSGLLAVLCLVAGIVLMRYQRFGSATLVVFAPVLLMGIVVLVALLVG